MSVDPLLCSKIGHQKNSPFIRFIDRSGDGHVQEKEITDKVINYSIGSSLGPDQVQGLVCLSTPKARAAFLKKIEARRARYKKLASTSGSSGNNKISSVLKRINTIQKHFLYSLMPYPIKGAINTKSIGALSTNKKSSKDTSLVFHHERLVLYPRDVRSIIVRQMFFVNFRQLSRFKLTFPFRNGEKVEALAWIIRKDGSVEPAPEGSFSKDEEFFEDPGHLKRTVSFPPLKRGDIIYTFFNRKIKFFPFEKGKFEWESFIDDQVAALSKTVEVVIPQSTPLSTYLISPKKPVSKLSQEGSVIDIGKEKFRKYKWDFSNTKRVPWEENYNDMVRKLVFTSFTSWDKLVRPWVQGHKGVFRAGPELKKEIERIDSGIKGKKTEWNMAKAFYYYIINKYGYSSPKTHFHTLMPADKVFKEKTSDCKGLSTLLVSMLREKGIKAYIAWVESDNIPHDVMPENVDTLPDHIPTSLQFDHQLVYVKFKNGTSVWLDPTSTITYVDGTADSETKVPTEFGKIPETIARRSSKSKPRQAMVIFDDNPNELYKFIPVK